MASCGDSAATGASWHHAHFLIAEHVSGKRHMHARPEPSHTPHSVQYSPRPMRRPEDSSNEDEKMTTLNPNKTLSRKHLKKSIVANISLNNYSHKVHDKESLSQGKFCTRQPED